MYSVSENFIIQMGKANRYEHLRGTIDDIPFDDDNIINLNYTNRNSDTSDISIGYCYTGQISASLTGINISRGSWRGKTINLEYGLEFPDESIEWIPIGVFTIVKAEWTDTAINITASDILSVLDKPFILTQTTGSIYDLIILACQELRIQFARTELEISNLPNGDQIFGLYPNNDIKTFKDYFGWISQLVGGYFTATRDGKLTLKSWNESQTVDSLGSRDRVIGSVFSDYSTSYSGISIVDIENNQTIYIPNESGVGTVINLGSNPFLQYGTKETLMIQLQNIADVTEDMSWTPFQISVLNNPAYDLGDLITCTGGVAGQEILSCCIMEIDWTIKQTTSLQGYGSDPNLADARSKVDKEISGIKSRTSENEVIFYTFINAQDFELGEDEAEKIVHIRFATINPKIVNLWHEINLDVTATSEDGIVTCQALYYLDGDLITYSPVTTWNNDGFHLMHLMYFINALEQNSVHEWEVFLLIQGGTATIDVGDIHASIYGQGLVATDEWDGYIEAEDSISVSFNGNSIVSGISENVVIESQNAESISAADIVTASFVGGLSVGNISDSVSIEIIKDIYYISSEDGEYRLISEDGQYNIESEE